MANLCPTAPFEPGMLPRPTPPHPAPQKASLAPPALPRKKQALPRPAEIDKTRGAQRGKADYRLNRLSEAWNFYNSYTGHHSTIHSRARA